MLLGYAIQRLSDWNSAQEVVQLTFIRAYEQIEEYREEADFGIWLSVICKHFILTELERRRREARNLTKYHSQIELKITENRVSALEHEEKAVSSLKYLKGCMESLQERSQSLIQFRYFEKMSCAEIAELEQRSVTWVTSTLARIRKKIRE